MENALFPECLYIILRIIYQKYIFNLYTKIFSLFVSYQLSLIIYIFSSSQ